MVPSRRSVSSRLAPHVVSHSEIVIAKEEKEEDSWEEGVIAKEEKEEDSWEEEDSRMNEWL